MLRFSCRKGVFAYEARVGGRDHCSSLLRFLVDGRVLQELEQDGCTERARAARNMNNIMQWANK